MLLAGMVPRRGATQTQSWLLINFFLNVTISSRIKSHLHLNVVAC